MTDRNQILEEAARAAEAVPSTLPHRVDVPAQEDLTSMGTPYMADPYSFMTTRRSTVKDAAAAIRALKTPTV